MVEIVLDGIELEDTFLDELWVAIRDKIPADTWVPIKKDHQRVLSGLKHIIDCACYGENFDVALHENMTHFKKISGFEPMPQVFKRFPVKNHPPGYWAEQDELRLERQKREYLKAQRAEKHETQRARTYKKSRKKR